MKPRYEANLSTYIPKSTNIPLGIEERFMVDVYYFQISWRSQSKVKTDRISFTTLVENSISFDYYLKNKPSKDTIIDDIFSYHRYTEQVLIYTTNKLHAYIVMFLEVPETIELYPTKYAEALDQYPELFI